MTDWSHRDDPDWDFTQSGEQKWIQAFAERHGPGTFLDLGAYDGVTGSNTRWLALHGWEGVCVEPAAAAFQALAEVYASDLPEGTYAQVQCAQTIVAFDPDSPLRTFFYSPTDLVSTTDYDHFRLWKNDARFVRVHASAVTLDQLLTYFCDWRQLDGRYFDLVSIDTEGTALQLLTLLRRHDAWRDVRMVIVEFQDGEQEYEIHDICGRDDWAVLERTSNNVVLERR